MGKTNRKMHKKRERQQNEQINREIAVLQETLDRQYENMDYDGALETVVKLFEHKWQTPEIMFKAAQIFFLQGDYKRAAMWVDNTLGKAPGHIEARLLLARICLMEERIEDAMAIYDVLVANGTGVLTAEQQDNIKEATDYIVRTDGAWLRENYPLVANLVMPAGADDNKPKTQKVLPVQEMISTAADDNLDHSLTDIMNSPVSLRKKIILLNAYAGGYFISGEYDIAKKFLLKAEEIDAHDNMTLRNLALLTKEMGDTNGAMAYVGRMDGTDFVLLKQLLN